VRFTASEAAEPGKDTGFGGAAAAVGIEESVPRANSSSQAERHVTGTRAGASLTAASRTPPFSANACRAPGTLPVVPVGIATVQAVHGPLAKMSLRGVLQVHERPLGAMSFATLNTEDRQREQFTYSPAGLQAPDQGLHVRPLAKR